MLLMVDNYDSFVYNLVQYFGELKQKVAVFRNDAITTERIMKLKPSHIVISPGPGRPEDAGISCDVIKTFAGKIPILGVCLGHQCIGYVYGGKIVKAERLMHGKTSLIYHKRTGIYKGIPSPFTATRYHSLIIKKGSLPPEIIVDAWTEEDEIMGIRHKNHKLFGVQFHPEAVLTQYGKTILKNFLSL
ncbi:MAG TPA: aminodeoxychorismate/anthranilate synthase component II [bacterium]|nr:aminodeoxychorismate/anthranilate synthase component II [bacterium]HPP30062.1 aminodeoxychorismate/anthranilate synthase component II [bacterium]